MLLKNTTQNSVSFLPERKSLKSTSPNFTVKRHFALKNSGPLPFYVSGFFVGDQSCQAFGFRVVDCGGFHLAPNESKTITIT